MGNSSANNNNSSPQQGKAKQVDKEAIKNLHLNLEPLELDKPKRVDTNTRFIQNLQLQKQSTLGGTPLQQSNHKSTYKETLIVSVGASKLNNHAPIHYEEEVEEDLQEPNTQAQFEILRAKKIKRQKDRSQLRALPIKEEVRDKRDKEGRYRAKRIIQNTKQRGEYSLQRPNRRNYLAGKLGSQGLVLQVSP